MNYSLGKIYKLEPVCDHPEGDMYIGATCQPKLSQRLAKHHSNYKLWKLEKGNNVSSHILFDKYGFENCEIILIESVNCNSKDELSMREAFHIRNSQCVNKCIPLRTKKEYYTDNRDKKLSQQRDFYIKNQERLSLKSKTYYINNQEKIAFQQKQNRINNPEKMKEIYAVKYLKNREVILARQKAYEASHNKPCICVCGGSYQNNSGKNTHFKTNKHIKYIESHNNIISE
jgi:hypothetical protein